MAKSWIAAAITDIIQLQYQMRGTTPLRGVVPHDLQSKQIDYMPHSNENTIWKKHPIASTVTAFILGCVITLLIDAPVVQYLLRRISRDAMVTATNNSVYVVPAGAPMWVEFSYDEIGESIIRATLSDDAAGLHFDYYISTNTVHYSIYDKQNSVFSSTVDYNRDAMPDVIISRDPSNQYIIFNGQVLRATVDEYSGAIGADGVLYVFDYQTGRWALVDD